MPAFLAVDPITAAPDGSFFAAISGGTPDYTFSLDGGAFVPATAISFFGVTTYYLDAPAGTAAIGQHTVVVRDSASTIAEATRSFEVSIITVVAGCNNTGPGNLQGVIQISYDTAAYPDARTATVRVDGQPLGYAQTGAEPILVFLANGLVDVSLIDIATSVVVATKRVEIRCGNSTPLVITSVYATLASTATATDATAVATMQDGNGAGPSFVVETHTGNFDWVAATPAAAPNFTANLTGLASGQHTLFVRDSLGGTAQYTFNVGVVVVRGCTAPSATNYNALATENDGSCTFAPVVPKPYFSISLMNTLRLVEMGVAGPPTLDNRLYCGEDWGGVTRPPYYQKVTRGDRLTTQFRSNYAAHVCIIRRVADETTIDTIVPVLKVKSTNIQRQYAAWLVSAPGNPQASRLFFNGGLLPLSFVVGDEVNVLNATPTSLNNRYAVLDIDFDATESIPYITINAPYPVTTPPTPRVNITATTSLDVLPYDVYEMAPNPANLPDGLYYAEITAVAGAGAFVERVYRSEPFALYAEHKNTVLISYRNYDDALGLSFSTGLLCNVRVEADFWQRQPGGTRRTYRDPSGRLVKLSAVAHRKNKLQTFKLPPWLHEKLAFIFDLDRFDINGVEYQSEDGYTAPTYNTRYALANGEVVLEQVAAFTDQNGTDLGDVNGIAEDFIITNDRFLKA